MMESSTGNGTAAQHSVLFYFIENCAPMKQKHSAVNQNRTAAEWKNSTMKHTMPQKQYIEKATNRRHSPHNQSSKPLYRKFRDFSYTCNLLHLLFSYRYGYNLYRIISDTEVIITR